MRYSLLFLLCMVSVASPVEPGLRVKAGPSVFKFLGTVGDDIAVGGADFTLGTGGYLDLSYRMQESFSMGFRFEGDVLGLSQSDRRWYDRARFSQFSLVSLLVFNVDEDARPFVTAGLGFSWLGWDYVEPFQPFPDEPDFTITSDGRRATTFMFGGGVELAVGERWEVLPALQVCLHGWSDHTSQGITQLKAGRDGTGDVEGVSPTNVSVAVSVGVARRW